MGRSITGVILAAALMVLPAPGLAQVIENPIWTQPPDPDLSPQLLPGFAGWLGISGQAELSCRLVEDGHPFNCRVNSEGPEGLGFGAAARVVIASGELRTRRIDGAPAPGLITTTVRFHAPPTGEEAPLWQGPEPSPAHLAQARTFVEARDFPLPTPASIDGLDVDRREVVQAWLTELFPITRERTNEIRALHMARLFSPEEIARLSNSEPVEWPSLDELRVAFPEPNANEEAARLELRRRYCGRYGCDVQPPEAPEQSPTP